MKFKNVSSSSSDGEEDLTMPAALEAHIKITGLFTYENIVETILQREIEDEFDSERNTGFAGTILGRLTQFAKGPGSGDQRPDNSHDDPSIREGDPFFHNNR